MAGTKICTVPDCSKSHEAHGYCRKHYQRFKLFGDPNGTALEFRSGRQCQVPNCDSPTIKRGFCSKHYQRFRVHGDPLAGSTFHGDLQRFLNNHVTYQADDCLIWPFSKNDRGCCPMNVGSGLWEIPTRIMCRMAHGEAPSTNHEAAHSCGNGHLACINPKHLRWATPKENNADKYIHGTIVRGEDNYNAVLTEETVRKIRNFKSFMTYDELADLFSISKGTIVSACLGDTWSHVD